LLLQKRDLRIFAKAAAADLQLGERDPTRSGTGRNSETHHGQPNHRIDEYRENHLDQKAKARNKDGKNKTINFKKEKA
jgi:hypothetical protein